MPSIRSDYNQLYQDQVVTVSDITYAFKPNPDTTTVTFKLLQNGQPLDPKQADNLSMYWVPYKDGKFQFEPALDRLSVKGKITSDGKGTVTSTLVELAQRRQSLCRLHRREQNPWPAGDLRPR